MTLTGNFDECVRKDTDDTVACASLISVMPGIWASTYPLMALLSFKGTGGILYGGLSIFNEDFNDSFVNAAVKYVDWVSTVLPNVTGAWNSLPAEIKKKKQHIKMHLCTWNDIKFN